MSLELPTSDVGTRVFSGARAIFIFNGTPVAYASGCDGGEEIQYEPVECLDNLAVLEHVPTGYRVSFSANIFRTVASGASTDAAPGSLKEQGIFPKFGAKGQRILQMTGVLVLIQDRNTGKTLYMAENVKPASTHFNIGARTITGQNVTFVATKILDESEIAASSAAA